MDKPSVLVVDDDEASRRLLRAMLGEEHYLFREASDGRAALATLLGGGIDLVISDVLMPGMDGYRLACESRRVGLRTPIILVTGSFRDAGDDELGLAMGADAVLGKPVDARQLEETIVSVRGPRGPRRAPGTDVMERYATRVSQKLGSRIARVERDRARLQAQNDELAALGRELLLERARLRAVLETTRDGVLGIDAEGRIRFANEAAARALGYGGQDLLARPARDLLHPTQEEGCPLCDAFDRRADVAASRAILVRADGSTFPAHASLAHPSGAGDSILVFRDATLLEQEAARERAAEREAVFQATFDLAPIPLAIGTADGRISAVNAAFARLIGRPASTFAGQPWGPFATPEDEAAARAHAMAIEAGSSGIVELNLRAEDGGVIPAETGWAILPAGNGDSPRYIGYARDLRPSRDAAKEREHAIAVAGAAERLASLGLLVAGVAHEINNPLTYIHGSIELIEAEAKALRTDGISDAALTHIEEDARTALRGLERIGAITRGLRRVARRGPGRRASVDLNAVVDDVLAIARPRLGVRTDLRIELAPDARVHGDGNELAQVVLNLLFNAGDALGERPGRVTVRTRVEGERVTLSVEDDGPGIPAEAQASIFTPFFTTKPEGTGLGLSICRSIARDHGGELAFATTPGAGTTFTMALPKDHRDEEASA